PANEQNLYRYNYYPDGTPIPPNSFYIPDNTWTSDDVVAATGVSLQELQTVNPSVDLNNLVAGQTINLPAPDNSLADFSTSVPGGPVQGTTGNDFLNGLALDDPSFTLQVNAAYLNGDGIYNVLPSGLVTEFYRPGAQELVAFNPNSIYNIWDSTTFNLQYTGLSNSLLVETSLSANLYGGASFILNVDPLVLDLNGDGVKLTDYQSSPVFFDIDHDGGSLELTGWVSAEDGIVVMDLNSDGIINDSSEMLSEYYGGAQGTKPFSDGFAALASLDSNFDGKFDASDASFTTVRVWVDANHDAKTDAGELKTLAELSITRINLTATPQSGEVVGGNEVLSRGSYTTADEINHDAAAINFLANPNGHTFTTSGAGTQVNTEGGVTSYVSQSATGEVIDVTVKGVQSAYGGSGNDTLIGDANSNWLAGGAGSDTLQGGAGNDVLIIDAADLQANIDAGAGLDIVQVVGDAGVTLNLTQAHVEVAQGGRGNDVLIGGGRANVFIAGGAGDDVIIGGAADDALSGEDGNDL
ncbi:MAG: calcium-binding protein, partial [Planctomycetota bacterium]